MQICLLSELFYPYMLGGAERRYYEIAVRLANKHEITVYALRMKGHEKTEMHRGVEIRRVGMSHPTERRRLPPLTTYFPALLKSMNSKYDIIDSNQGMASFAGLLKPLVKKPVIATFHDIYWNQWGDHFAFPFSTAGKLMEFFWSKLKYTCIIANSPKTKEKLEMLGFGGPVETIASGLDIEFIDGVRPKKAEKTIVYVGRLEKYKAVDSLISAVHEVSRGIRGVKLKIIGSGSEETYLKMLAKELSVNVEFLGFLSEKEKIMAMKSAAVVVNPSHVEGLGLVVLEAMACSVPVVVRNLDCYFFCSKDNSIRYEKDEELSVILTDLLSSPGLGKRLSRNGFKTSRMFSWDETAKKVDRLYSRLV